MKNLTITLTAFVLFALTTCSTPNTTVRELVFIGETELSAQLTDPPFIFLRITGDLPTVCHAFNYEYEIQSDGRIDISIYSTIDAAATCIQGLHPFDETVEIPLSGQPSGSYQIYLNDEWIGTIEYSAVD
jgi:hypothetical protein